MSMIMRVSLSSLLLPVFLVVNCAAAQAPGAAKPQPGTLHIYRILLDIGKASHPTVSCDSFDVARMQNGRVYTLKVSPGRHNLRSSGSPTGLNVDVESGKEYFVRIDYAPNASFGVGGSLVLVAPDQGRQEIRKLHPLDGWFVETGNCG